MSYAHSARNAYANILSCPANLGAQKEEQHYNLFFNNSTASSIPLIRLPENIKTTRSVDFSSSSLDYSDLFQGLNDHQDMDVSYQDLTTSSCNVRTQSATTYPMNSSEHSTFSQENQVNAAEASFQSIDNKKQFKMPFHKTREGSEGGSSGTVRVARFHPEPGFTYLVNGSTMQESEVDKPDPSVTSDTGRKLDFSDVILESIYTKKGMPHLHTQKSNRREDNSKSRLYEGGSYSSDNAHGINLTPHPTNERLPPRVKANLENNNGLRKRSMTSNSEAPKGIIASQHATDDNSPPFFGEEFDVNSAAAVSAAALKDAIQKAQESIRIAKEMMERKMGGLRNRSDRLFQDRLRVKHRKENFITHEGSRTKHINAKGTGETVDSVPNYLSGRWKSTFRREQDSPDFEENEITSTSWKVIGDVHTLNRPKTGKPEPALATILNVGKNRTSLFSLDQQVTGNREIAQFMYKHECNANERNITKETLIKQEIISEKEEEDETSHKLRSSRNKLHADVTEKELAENVDKLSKHDEMENLIFQEDGVRVSSGIESQQKIEYEMIYGFHVFKDTDFEKKIHITRKQDLSKQQANSQQEDMKNETENFDELRQYRPRTICDDDIEEERFEDACEWVQNEDEPIVFLDSVSNDKEGNATYMAEITERGRRLVRIDVPTNGKKRSIDVHDYEESGEKFEELKLIESKNGLSRDTSDNITETQGSCQPCMIDESSNIEQVNDTSRIIDKAANNVYDFKVGEAEETKVVSKLNKIDSFETATLVQGGAEEGETRKNTNTVFEVLPSEGSIPKVGLIDIDLKNSEAEHRDKEFKSNIYPDKDPRISYNRYIENNYAFEEGGNHFAEEAVKSHPEKAQNVVTMNNFKAYSGLSVHSEHEKVIKVDEEMRARRNTQMTGKSLCRPVAGEEDETKSDKGMKTENVMEINEDTPKVLFAMEGTETKNEKPRGIEEKEYLRKVYEESKRERQREIDRIAVGRVIQEARDRAFAEAREKVERASVGRATAEVRQRSLAETLGKLEKATSAVEQSAEKALIEAKLRSERVAVERATAEARERALKKALSEKNTSRTQVLRRPDDTYIESAQRSKARLERQERIIERVAKALAEKNMCDLLAQKEEAEKNRLAKTLDAQIKRWSTGKEGNLRALLSTLQYILGPGSGWQPISLTDIITSNAVKKAYRKATLYVHPDKLQQRGASIQEKYICEKVFDLLKVGWARFSSEER